MKRLAIVGALLAYTAAQAGEVGPLRTTNEAGDWALGLHYYWDISDWRTGSAAGDALIGDLEKQGPYANFSLAVHPRWELGLRAGGSKYASKPEIPGTRADSSLDGFYGIGVRGEMLRDDRSSVGPFIQYTRYSDYDITGTVGILAPTQAVTVETSGWQEVSGGIVAQHQLETADVYYGIYHMDQQVDVSGTFGTDVVDVLAREDRHTGIFVGAVKPVSRHFSVAVEIDRVSDWGASIGLNYNFQPPAPVVISKTEVRYVDTPKPTGPARIDRAVLFESGSTAVDKAHWRDIREFAEFLQTYDGSEGFIEGHCDCVGNDSYNMELSARRAAAVKVLLVELFGIEEKRLTVVAMGETAPAVEQQEGVGHPANRRVQLIGRAYGDQTKSNQTQSGQNGETVR